MLLTSRIRMRQVYGCYIKKTPPEMFVNRESDEVARERVRPGLREGARLALVRAHDHGDVEGLGVAGHDAVGLAAHPPVAAPDRPHRAAVHAGRERVALDDREGGAVRVLDLQAVGQAREPAHVPVVHEVDPAAREVADRKSTRLNSSHSSISYAVFCLKKK